jgi:hypothetical protein
MLPKTDAMSGYIRPVNMRFAAGNALRGEAA